MSEPEIQVHGVTCAGETEVMPTRFLPADRWHITLVRSGCFRYRSSAGDVLADTATGVLAGPSEEYAVSHPMPGGDTDTFLWLSEPAMASVAGGDLGRLPLELHVTPALEREQRALVAMAGLAGARSEVEERALVLIAALLAQRQPARVAAGSPRSDRARSLVEDARLLLMEEPELPMLELAALVGCSPHHLSRLFTRHTGGGIAAYRISVRATRAMALLTGGHGNLAEVAALAGYADQAHMSRALRSRFGATPSALRTELSG